MTTVSTLQLKTRSQTGQQNGVKLQEAANSAGHLETRNLDLAGLAGDQNKIPRLRQTISIRTLVKGEEGDSEVVGVVVGVAGVEVGVEVVNGLGRISGWLRAVDHNSDGYVCDLCVINIDIFYHKQKSIG